ncbi:MAG: HD domain-containing protein [Oscillospiraceae bacterium]|nr:HD domain-containing protein [Oscillospiraceae bacterium]
MKITMPTAVETAMSILTANGHEVFVVGGCVRDFLRGQQPNDWDLCTSAVPEETLKCFEGFNVIPTGLKHGTVTVVIQGTPLEITTFRVDGEYTDGRRPDNVTFTANITEDLARRDFTVNAMAYNEASGLVDPFGGRSDLEKGIIRCVGNPEQRFKEDALRILRGLRFAARFGFSIEQNTAETIKRLYPLLENIAAERIFTELCGFFKGEKVEPLLDEFADVFCFLMPCLSALRGMEQNHPYHLYDGYTHTIKAVQAAPPNEVLRFAALLHDTGKPLCKTTDEKGIDHFYGHPDESEKIAADVMQRMRADNETAHRVKQLVKLHDVRFPCNAKTVRRWLSRLGEKDLRDLWALQRADRMATRFTKEDFELLDNLQSCLDEVLRKHQCFSLKQLALNGKDLIALGIPKGKQVGTVLNFLLDAVLEQPELNTKQTLTNMVLRDYLPK